MAIANAEPLFIDTNTLVYANVAESPYHAQALNAIQTAGQAGRPLWISRQILREYLATMTRPQAFATLPRETVLQQVIKFVERFKVADDTPAVTQQLLALISNHQIGGKQVHDANIVATMQANSVPCLLTHNVKDFKQFGKLIKIEGIDSDVLL